MSGLAVVVDRSGQPIPAELTSALRRSVSHRGPDGIAELAEGNRLMVHASLRATGVGPGEQQPFVHPDGTWYGADLRIDNRQELAAKLGSGRWTTAPDVELLAELHHRWGARGVAAVVGDFAFVALRPDGSVEAFRDHMGVKPLYYWHSPRWIVIGSELRQISAHPQAPSAVDVAMAGQYLSGWVEDPAATIISGVRRLPGAHQLRLSAGASVERYWTPPLDDPIVLADQAAYTEQFRSLFTEAVRCRLPPDGPVGAHLSGGLDSTSAALMAARLAGPERVRAYSCLFPDTPGSDERPFIDAAVGAGGIAWAGVVSDPARHPWVDAEVSFWSDIPLPPDGLDHVALGRQARADGCRVVLTGHGGDHWFDTSHLVTADLVQHGRLGPAWRMAGSLSEPGVAATAATLLHLGLAPHKPSWLGRPGRRRAPWVTGVARTAARLDQRRIPEHLPRQFRSLAAQLRFQAEAGGFEAMTREIQDRIGARAGVELRHPYLDRRLMEFACRIPTTVHTAPGRLRSLQRAGLADLLPAEIVERTTKASFRALWLREIERHLPPAAISDSRLVALGWIDPAQALAAYERTRKAVARGSGGANSFALWGLVQMEWWLGRSQGPGCGSGWTPGSG
jgi:asparagine synthase (glutamine-hydrolysing)